MESIEKFFEKITVLQILFHILNVFKWVRNHFKQLDNFNSYL